MRVRQTRWNNRAGQVYRTTGKGRGSPWLGAQGSRLAGESWKTLLSPCSWSLLRAPSSAVRALASCCLCLCERQLWGAGRTCQPAAAFTEMVSWLGVQTGRGVPQGSAQTTYHLKTT